MDRPAAHSKALGVEVDPHRGEDRNSKGDEFLHDVRDHTVHNALVLTTQTGQYPQTPATADVINLAIGQPSPRLLPLAELGRAATRRLTESADPLLMQYGAVHGYESFRADLASFLTERYRFPVATGELLVTQGISGALSLVAELFARDGDVVVCGDPTYFLARGIFESQHLRMLGIEVDEGGLRVDILEHALAGGLRPALVYCLPSFHNPRAVNLEPARAEQLIVLAERYDFIVVADEPYLCLHFDESPPPCMMSFDRGRGRVLGLGSFAKLLGPGLRLGWVHASPPLVERIAAHAVIRSGGGLNPIVSALVHETIVNGFLAAHVDRLRSVFAARSLALAQAIREHLPFARFVAATGGYFTWVDLGNGFDTTAYLDLARTHHGVGYCPGSRCSISNGWPHHIRLSCAFYESHELEAGVKKLGAALFAARSHTLK